MPSPIIDKHNNVIPIYIITLPVFIDITKSTDDLLFFVSPSFSCIASILLILLSSALFVNVPVVLSVVFLVSINSIVLLSPGCISIPDKLFVCKSPLSSLYHFSFNSDGNSNPLGKLSVKLGAGRVSKEDKIDYNVGIYLNKLVGDTVKKGDLLATVYVNKNIKLDEFDDIFVIK